MAFSRDDECVSWKHGGFEVLMWVLSQNDFWFLFLCREYNKNTGVGDDFPKGTSLNYAICRFNLIFVGRVGVGPEDVLLTAFNRAKIMYCLRPRSCHTTGVKSCVSTHEMKWL